MVCVIMQTNYRFSVGFITPLGTLNLAAATLSFLLLLIVFISAIWDSKQKSVCKALGFRTLPQRTKQIKVHILCIDHHIIIKMGIKNVFITFNYRRCAYKIGRQRAI